MSLTPTENEQRLLDLCRRLLRQNEDLQGHNQDLHAHIDGLCEQLRWLRGKYEGLKARFDRAAADHAAIEAAYDAMLGGALSEPPSSTPSGRP
jgi:hypothetical protein